MIGTHQTNLESLYLHFSVLCQLEKYCPFYLFIDLNNDAEFGRTTFQEFYHHHKVEVTVLFFSKWIESGVQSVAGAVSLNQVKLQNLLTNEQNAQILSGKTNKTKR